MADSAFMRARRPEHKQQRREAILAAARELALRSGVRNVSLGGVAAAVGLAKSNVGRYFGTREEIYLELAAEEWRRWDAAAAERLSTAEGADDVVAALVDTVAELPLLCDLLGHTSTSLEHNVSLPAARAFKQTVSGVVTRIGERVAKAHPELTASEGTDLVSVVVMLAGSLYPLVNPPETMKRLYAENPEIAALCPPFVPTMRRAATVFAAGLPRVR
ncbi:TetR family transcriptional regulator [Sphaerisporangium sp. TRM90804]|uniref:TetR/AcrR family transcriptional regulator n=1 Tax=Sphaerisporangium sp. TRM90804 TaxID=3031113 RepID=UPI00244C3746|nr:TetR family transcriptional regulator [Sphaerisporangium sp. TRM90804]MDH2425441.1 TetR family transcriptional regulator [Sphaerisporangium sp. TRM90804]